MSYCVHVSVVDPLPNYTVRKAGLKCALVGILCPAVAHVSECWQSCFITEQL